MIDPAFVVRAQSRRSVRRGVRLRCEVVDDRRFALVARRAVDLSEDGMLVECNRRDVDVGDTLVISFRAPGTSLWIDASGRVARVVRGRRPSDRGRCLGISFEGLSLDDRAALKETLRHRPPPLPSRGLRRDYVSTIAEIAAL